MNNPVCQQNTVLLIDDDEEYTSLLKEYIEQFEFNVISCNDPFVSQDVIERYHPKIIVLDVMMPGKDGITLLRELRQESLIPVIMLTARGDDVDRILGLELGADDYVRKPCNPRELVARIRALLRRGQVAYEALHSHADLQMNSRTRTATLNDQPLILTSTEYSLLLCLMENIGKVVPKQTLYAQALGRQPEKYERTIDMHISNLRRKLGIYPDGTERFQTIRGIGYQLNSIH